jgi:hypothetical protein
MFFISPGVVFSLQIRILRMQSIEIVADQHKHKAKTSAIMQSAAVNE